MTTSLYTFKLFLVDGTKQETGVAAQNMNCAVAQFMNTNTVPYMTCMVKVSNGLRWHQVTREKFGHFFDGRVDSSR